MAAKRKYYLTQRFETKEDFDKHFDSIYNSGYSEGIRDGRINALSYFLDVINEQFDDNESKSAAYEMGERHKAEWKRKIQQREDQERYLRKKIEEEMQKKSEES